MSICIQCCSETVGSQLCGICARKSTELSNPEKQTILTEAQQQELDALVRDTVHVPKVDGSMLIFEEVLYRSKFYRTDLAEDGQRRAWCNNFHNLFLALYDQLKQPTNPLHAGEHRLSTVESTGQYWQSFLHGNQALIEQICVVLVRYPIISRIRRLTLEVIQQHNWEEASLQSIHDLFDPVVGIDCFEMAFWKDLDPLLRQAWKAMEVAGVDPTMIDA